MIDISVTSWPPACITFSCVHALPAGENDPHEQQTLVLRAASPDAVSFWLALTTPPIEVAGHVEIVEGPIGNAPHTGTAIDDHKTASLALRPERPSASAHGSYPRFRKSR
jgi:hypothetical protein